MQWGTDHSEWHAWFAWHPVMTIGRRHVWLERVERRWNIDLNDLAGDWEYRLPLAN